MQNIVDALLRERQGYQRRGLAHRVALVEAELERLGAWDATPSARSAPKKGRKR